MTFKKIFTFFLGVWLILLFIFSVNAVDIDGVMDEVVWKKAYKTTLFTSSDIANCNVKSAVLTITEEPKTNRLIFGFKVKLTDSIDGSLNYGAAVSLNSSDFITVQPDFISDYDTDLFGVEYGIEATGDDSFCAEIAVGLKYGLNTAENIKVRIIDANGSPSTVFNVNYSIISYSVQSEASNTEKSTICTENNNVSDVSENKSEIVTEINTKRTKTTVSKKSATKAAKTTKSKTIKKVNEENRTVIKSTSEINQITLSADSNISHTSKEATTTLNMKQVNFYRNTYKVLVIVIILLALCVCVAVNVIRERKKNKK